MWGRYGADQLGLCLLGTAAALGVLSWILPLGKLLYGLLNLVAYGLLGLYLFRALSRNLDARRRENQSFLCLFRSLRDRENRYYRCPKCKQLVRVPRGRGKIQIRCPKCDEKFIRKS